MFVYFDVILFFFFSFDGCELVSVGYDVLFRFWSLEKWLCMQEIISYWVMCGEGVCLVVWSQDGKWVVSGGGDGLVKVFVWQRLVIMLLLFIIFIIVMGFQSCRYLGKLFQDEIERFCEYEVGGEVYMYCQ